MNRHLRPGSLYNPVQLRIDCNRIVSHYGKRVQRGFYTIGVYEDRMIEIEGCGFNGAFTIVYKHRDGGRTRDHLSPTSAVALDEIEQVYEGSLERILQLAVYLDEGAAGPVNLATIAKVSDFLDATDYRASGSDSAPNR